MRAWESFLKIQGWRSDYESVTLYLAHYKRLLGSESTKEHAVDVLMSLCKFADKTPDQLRSLSSVEASRLLQRHIDELKDENQSIRTVNVSLGYLKMFFRVNGFKGEKELEVERYHQPARYRKRPEYVPTSEEIFKMAYSAGSSKNKAMVLALYTSGLRNSTLRAVLYGDIEEELQKNEVVKISVTPEMKRVEDDACKNGIAYYTFISKETVQALKEYLAQRVLEYGSIEDTEPLFISTSTNVPPQVRRHTLVKKRSLDELVKRAAKNAGIPNWKDVYPHCLRKAFESALRNAGLDLKDQEFLMGHILAGTMDTYYDKTKVEQLRPKYAKVNFFPERGLTEDDRKRQMLDTARLYGYSDDKIKKIEDALAKYKHVDEALEEIRKLSLESTKKQVQESNQRSQTNTSNIGKKEIKIVKGENNLVQLLKEKWELLKEISDDRFVLTRLYE
jgi:integrase